MEGAKWVAFDSTYYIHIADVIYDANNLNTITPYALQYFPLYPLLLQLPYNLLGTSYIAIQIFYFVVVFFGNILFYIFLYHISSIENTTNIFQSPLFFYLTTLVYLFNYVVFCVDINRLLPENILLILTMGTFLLTLKAIQLNSMWYYVGCFLIYPMLLLTKPQGIAVIAGIFIFALSRKNKPLIIISILSFTLFLTYFLIILRYKSPEVGYENAILFINWNFYSLVLGLYRLLFFIPYELFFSDAFSTKLMKLSTKIGVIAYLPYFIISPLMWGYIVLGLVKFLKNNFFNQSCGFLNYVFIISLIGFFLHTSPSHDTSSVTVWYTSRLLIYLWPLFTLYFITSLKNKFLSSYPGYSLILVAIIFNIGLLTKNCWRNFTTLRNYNYSFKSIALNNAKIACMGSEKVNTEVKNLVAYKVFRKACKNYDKTENYDYILTFDENSEIPKSYRKVFSVSSSREKFAVYSQNGISSLFK